MKIGDFEIGNNHLGRTENAHEMLDTVADTELLNESWKFAQLARDMSRPCLTDDLGLWQSTVVVHRITRARLHLSHLRIEELWKGRIRKWQTIQSY